MKLTTVAALVVPLVVAATGGAARADGQAADCRVVEIVASNKKEGMDPRLDNKIKAKLGKQPFKGYDSFKVIGDHPQTAERKKPVSIALANGKVGLLFKQKVGRRLHFDVDRDDKAGKRVVTTTVDFDSGDMVIWAGEAYDTGTYVLVVSCSAP
jgi:hypothetical protein